MARKIAVKYYNFDFSGAPVLNGIAGTLLDVLNACLINGFAVKSVVSFVVSGGVGTLTFGSNPGFSKHQVIALSGASNDAYNGDWRVTGAAGSSVTVDATGISDTTIGGTLSARIAPLGWTKAFSGTNLAAYKSAATDATGIFLQVDDTVGQYAKVRGYETMTDVVTGTGMFPDLTQRTESNWGKSALATSAPRQWMVIGDDRFVYLVVHTEYDSLSACPNNRFAAAFGDFPSYKAGDAFSTLLTSISHPTIQIMQYDGWGNILCRGTDVGANGRAHIARSFSQSGGSSMAYFKAAGNYSGSNTGLTYPNPGDNSLLLEKTKFVVEVSTSSARGELPGYWSFLQDRPLTHGNILEDAVAGRVLMVIGTAFSSSGGADARFALDITGPWR